MEQKDRRNLSRDQVRILLNSNSLNQINLNLNTKFKKLTNLETNAQKKGTNGGLTAKNDLFQTIL